MTIVRSYVFVHLPEGPVPAGLLTMTDEPRNQFATFAYGRRYLERPDRIPVDPVALPLHDAGTSRTFRTEEGFAVFGGIRDAAPDGWGQYLMYKAMGDRLPSEIDLILASGEHRVGALAFGPTPERPERITPWGDGPAPGEEFTLAELAEAAERARSCRAPRLCEGQGDGEGHSWQAKRTEYSRQVPSRRLFVWLSLLAASEAAQFSSRQRASLSHSGHYLLLL